MIADDQQLQVTLDRISRFQKQIVQIRQSESNPANYQKSIAGFLSEIDRMQLEVRDTSRCRLAKSLVQVD